MTFVEEGDYLPIAKYLVDNAQGSGNDDGGGSNGGDGNGPNDGNDDAGNGEPCDGFSCSDGTCIDDSWKCDGYSDCSGGEDESGCPSNDDGTNDGTNDDTNDDGTNDDDGGACSGFSCNDGTCIEQSWVCDQENDCSGGEDEASCAGVAVDDPADLSGPIPTQASKLACVATWTVGGAGTGALAAEAITKTCEGAGMIAGFYTGGSGFAAAIVCATADVVQLDALVGGVLGGVAGLVGGVANCEDQALAEANAALESALSKGTVPTFRVESKDGTTSEEGEEEVCGVPRNLPEPPPEKQQKCKDMWANMDAYRKSVSWGCKSINVQGVNKTDDAAVEAACQALRDGFDKASELSRLKHEIGEECHPNGKRGPMGNSNLGHQRNWCEIQRARLKCTEKARQLLVCNEPEEMSLFYPPAGCENLIENCK